METLLLRMEEIKFFKGSWLHDQDGLTPIYGKNPLKISSSTRGPIKLGHGMLHWGNGAYQVCSNTYDDPRLTLTYLKVL